MAAGSIQSMWQEPEVVSLHLGTVKKQGFQAGKGLA